MSSRTHRENPDAESSKSFSALVRSEVAALSVKDQADKASLAAGLSMPGVTLKREAKELYEKLGDSLQGLSGKVSLDTTGGGRLFLRGVFLACGYITNPRSAYRIELRPVNGEAAATVERLLEAMDVPYTTSQRDGIHIIYIRSGDAVSDFLGIIGSNTGRLQFESIRTEREVYSGINRAVNCDSGNTGRQAEAAARRGELIGKLLNSPKAKELPKELYEAALVHQANPGASIAELGREMHPPIGKSGMNHRLSKLLEIAQSL